MCLEIESELYIEEEKGSYEDHGTAAEDGSSRIGAEETCNHDRQRHRGGKSEGTWRRGGISCSEVAGDPSAASPQPCRASLASKPHRT